MIVSSFKFASADVAHPSVRRARLAQRIYDVHATYGQGKKTYTATPLTVAQKKGRLRAETRRSTRLATCEA